MRLNLMIIGNIFGVDVVVDVDIKWLSSCRVQRSPPVHLTQMFK